MNVDQKQGCSIGSSGTEDGDGGVRDIHQGRKIREGGDSSERQSGQRYLLECGLSMVRVINERLVENKTLVLPWDRDKTGPKTRSKQSSATPKQRGSGRDEYEL